MKDKKALLFWKIVAAAIVSFAVLNLVCVLYYNVPIHGNSENDSTDYIWEKNKFYSRGTEGFAMGVTDKNGFNNLETFEKGEIDVLLMGSSHMEAFNVAQDKNTAAILNNKFRESGLNLKTYNIGISGHSLITCLNNLEDAIKEFAPQKFVVIETQTIKPSTDDIIKALKGTLPTIASHNEGIVGQLQKFPYLRLIYLQLKNAAKDNNGGNNSEPKKESSEDERYRLLDELISKSVEPCKTAGVKPIIFYNCEIKVDEQGKIIEQENIEYIERFKTACEKNDVIFLNMYSDFEEYYNENYKLPRGFSNTKIGSGHINEDGHHVIAERLFSEICR